MHSVFSGQNPKEAVSLVRKFWSLSCATCQVPGLPWGHWAIPDPLSFLCKESPALPMVDKAMELNRKLVGVGRYHDGHTGNCSEYLNG